MPHCPEKRCLTSMLPCTIIPFGIIKEREERIVEKKDEDLWRLSDEINRGIIQCRGVYAAWSRQHGISYNRMLVLYMIRECGFCTQKRICGSYLLPPQTVNHVITGMREEGLLAADPGKSKGREKAFVLTQRGEAYATPLLDSLTAVEQRAAERLGGEKLRQMIGMLLEYDRILRQALKESEL